MRARHPVALPVLAYDLSHWRGFLLPVVIPTTLRLSVVVGESNSDILERIPADFTGTFAFHINLTDSSACPRDRAGLLAQLHARGIGILNAGPVDISKRFVQAACQRAGLRSTLASRQGDPSEVLIVKTDRNYGGIPEARLSRDDLNTLAISAYAIDKQPDHGYVVAPRRDLPVAVWDDPSRVVERYIENQSQLFYRIYLLGNRCAISEGREQAWVKTIGRSQRQRLVLFSIDPAGKIDGAIPPDLQTAVSAVLDFVSVTELDFGCLDLMRDDSGNFYIVDMNTTATWGAETEVRIIEYLAPRDESQ